MYMYHGTVWSLHQVPQRWKWQSLNILVVVHRHDRDFTGTNLSNQRGRLDATHGTLPAISEHITRMRSRAHISSHESPHTGMGDLTFAMIATYSSG